MHYGSAMSNTNGLKTQKSSTSTTVQSVDRAITILELLANGGEVGVTELARELGVQSLALLGKGGGRAVGLATWEVVIDSRDTARIQEAHQFILHWLCDQIEAAFPPA